MHKTLAIVRQVEAAEKVASDVGELKAQIAELHTKFDALLEALAKATPSAEPHDEAKNHATQIARGRR